MSASATASSSRLPMRTKTLALQAVLGQLPKLYADAIDEFIALSSSDQAALYQSIISPGDIGTLTPQVRNEKVAMALTYLKVRKATEVLHGRLLDALYRSTFKGQGVGFQAAKDEAMQGHRNSLLNIARLFHDAPLTKPFREIMLEQFERDETFDRQYRKAIAIKPEIDHRAKKYEDTLWYLCLNIELIFRYRDRQLTIYDLYDKLYEEGLHLHPDQATFRKWIKRTFRDILSVAK